jgi:hypothetical protein
MVAEQTPTPERYDMVALRDLIAERVTERFATFDEVGEGEFFPNGTESMSGHVILEDGRVFFFWMDWDAERGGPTLGTWEEVEEDLSNDPSEEYQRAREAAGLQRSR